RRRRRIADVIRHDFTVRTTGFVCWSRAVGKGCSGRGYPVCWTRRRWPDRDGSPARTAALPVGRLDHHELADVFESQHPGQPVARKHWDRTTALLLHVADDVVERIAAVNDQAI